MCNVGRRSLMGIATVRSSIDPSLEGRRTQSLSLFLGFFDRSLVWCRHASKKSSSGAHSRDHADTSSTCAERIHCAAVEIAANVHAAANCRQGRGGTSLIFFHDLLGFILKPRLFEFL